MPLQRGLSATAARSTSEDKNGLESDWLGNRHTPYVQYCQRAVNGKVNVQHLYRTASRPSA